MVISLCSYVPGPKYKGVTLAKIISAKEKSKRPTRYEISVEGSLTKDACIDIGKALWTSAHPT